MMIPKFNLKALPWRIILRAACLAMGTALSCAVYSACLARSEATRLYVPVLEVYCVAIGVLLVTAAILNRGFGNELYENPEAYCMKYWPEKKKERFLASLPRRKKAKQVLSCVIFCLSVPVAVDILKLCLLDALFQR